MKKCFAILLLLSIFWGLLPQPAQAAPSLVSNTAVLMDADSGQVLWQKNMHVQKSPASITKVLTALLGVENLQEDDILVMSHDAVFTVPVGSSHIALDEGEELPFSDALAAMMTVSANDAANGIAEQVAGSMDAFADLMNQRAAELGAQNSHFVNPSGLYEEEHYTTAYDMALITRAAVQNPLFMQYFNISSYEMEPTNKQEETRYFHNQDDFIYAPNKQKYDFGDYSILGGKLGWTRLSNYTMVTVAECEGRTLIAVVMDCATDADKYTDTLALFDYGFHHFQAASLSPEAISAAVGGDWVMETDFDFLLQEDYALTDVSIALDETTGSARAVFRLTDESGAMYPEIGSLSLLRPLENVAASGTVLAPEESAGGFRWWYIPLALVGLFLLFYVFLYIRHQQKKRRRRLARMRARRSMRQL